MSVDNPYKTNRISSVVLILALFSFILGGCEYRKTIKKLRVENENLQKKVDQKNTEIQECMNFNAECMTKLEEARGCALEIEELYAERITPDVFDFGQDYVVSPCDENLKVRIARKDLERGWVYFRYQVKDETRWSDRLWLEDKRDRSSLFIKDLDKPVLLTAESCDQTRCEASCQILDTKKMMCFE